MKKVVWNITTKNNSIAKMKEDMEKEETRNDKKLRRKKSKTLRGSKQQTIILWVELNVKGNLNLD